MPVLRPLRSLMALAFAGWCAGALAQVSLSNPSPTPLETVRVQIPEGAVGNFAQRNQYPLIDETATRITMAGNKITVTLRMLGNIDFTGIPPSQPVDLSVGQFPKGDYSVEVLRELPDGTPAGSIGTASFTVAPVPSGSIGPVPAINYSDLWWNPNESGWGLNVIQHGSGVIFATWFVYGADGRPTWYVMPSGNWNSSNQYTGSVYRTTGPALGTAFDPASVTRIPVGYGTLLFNFNGLGIRQASIVMDIDKGRIAKLITPQSF